MTVRLYARLYRLARSNPGLIAGVAVGWGLAMTTIVGAASFAFYLALKAGGGAISGHLTVGQR